MLWGCRQSLPGWSRSWCPGPPPTQAGVAASRASSSAGQSTAGCSAQVTHRPSAPSPQPLVGCQRTCSCRTQRECTNYPCVATPTPLPHVAERTLPPLLCPPPLHGRQLVDLQGRHTACHTQHGLQYTACRTQGPTRPPTPPNEAHLADLGVPPHDQQLVVLQGRHRPARSRGRARHCQQGAALTA